MLITNFIIFAVTNVRLKKNKSQEVKKPNRKVNKKERFKKEN